MSIVLNSPRDCESPQIPWIPLVVLTYTVLLEDPLDHCQLFSYHYQIHSAFLDNVLKTSTQVSDHLDTIILMIGLALFYQITMECKVYIRTSFVQISSIQNLLNLVVFLLSISQYFSISCHMQVHPSGNNIPAVKPPPNHTSPPSIAAIFLTTHLMVVLQPSRYSIFHSRDTLI